MSTAFTARQELAYELTVQMLRAIAEATPEVLVRFGITPAILEEIREELATCDLQGVTLLPPARHLALQPMTTGRIPFDLYETDDGTLRLDCLLWTATDATEHSLLADFEPDPARGWRLRFLMIEVQ